MLPASKKMHMRFHRKKVFLSFVIVTFLLVVFGFFLVFQTKQRLSFPVLADTDQKSVQYLSKDPPLITDALKTATLGQTANIKKKNSLEEEIWCEARDYVDLSEDPVFREFSRWLDTNVHLNCQKAGNCTDHDPRLLAQHFSYGESLARTRAEVFLKIIRGDPRKALNLAIKPEIIATLPARITSHLEKWESGFVDIQSIHRCFDENHPRGWIMNYAKFSNGQN